MRFETVVTDSDITTWLHKRFCVSYHGAMQVLLLYCIETVLKHCEVM